MELKKNEKLLLSYFRNNARQALTKISRQTGVPVSTIFDKLRKYESGIIKRHTSLLDFEKMGFTTRATVFLRTKPGNRPELSRYLKAHPSVNTVYRVNNGYDFLIEAVFKTVQEMEQFLETLEISKGVLGRDVHFVIEEVAREQFMAEPLVQ